MKHRKKVVDNLIEEYFGDIQAEITKDQAKVEQESISKGMFNSTVCAGAIFNVYSQAFDSKLEEMLCFIQDRCIRPNWRYLNEEILKQVAKIYESARAAVIAHSVKGGYRSQDACDNMVNKKKEIVLKDIKNKLELLKYSIDEKQSLNDRFISFIKHNPLLVWISATIIAILWILSSILGIISFLKSINEN